MSDKMLEWQNICHGPRWGSHKVKSLLHFWLYMLSGCLPKKMGRCPLRRKNTGMERGNFPSRQTHLSKPPAVHSDCLQLVESRRAVGRLTLKGRFTGLIRNDAWMRSPILLTVFVQSWDDDPIEILSDVLNQGMFEHGVSSKPERRLMNRFG